MKKPLCRSINFSVYDDNLNRYRDKDDLKDSYEKNGLNGLEVLPVGTNENHIIVPGMVNGVHLFYHHFWVDWWRKDYARLDCEFDSREQWIEYYNGLDQDVYLNILRQNLDYAERMGAKYVVFHVSEVTLRESYLYEYKYTDEEVVDASLEIINILLNERDYSFDFLVENLWWSGFNLKDISVTRKLLNGIESDKKGIMFDLGHWINTNIEVSTQEEALRYLEDMIKKYEQENLLKWFKGIHLQLSLSGNYVKEQKMEWKENPMDFEKIPFYELFRLSRVHMRDIDEHKPFLFPGIKQLIEKIDPVYLTYEFRQKSRQEYETMMEKQSKVLGYL